MTDANAERDPVEALASEFVERQRRGEQPSISEYAAKHPALAQEIRDLFPTIIAMEQLKVQKERGVSGRASLGPARLERLGDYRIVREIGRGGMGIVYEAVQESLGRHVAIKVLPKSALLDPKALKRFRREARIAAGLHHSNIAAVFGVGEQDHYHYFVMQYIRGVTLDRIIARMSEAGRERRGGETRETARELLERGQDAAHKEEGEASQAGHRAESGAMGRHWRDLARMARQIAQAIQYAHDHRPRVGGAMTDS